MMSDAQVGREGRAGARLTPYELVFGAAAFEEERFPAILEEGEGRGFDLSDPGRFVMLGTVAQLIEQILPEDAPGTAVEQYGRLLFHAFGFWRYDRYLLVAAEPLVRRLVETTRPIGEWQIAPPHPAGYLQLPRHLFWARVEPDATPEPVDGIFWSMIGRDDPANPPYARLDALLALGMRPDRPGLSVVALSETFPDEARGHWGDADARPDGPDFGNILPGGELDDLHALVTGTEVLKLLSRVFHHTATRPGSVREPERAALRGDGGAEPSDGAGGDASGEQTAAAPGATSHTLPPSGLPYRRVVEAEADG